MKSLRLLPSFVPAALLVAGLLLLLGGAAIAGPTVPPVLIDQSPAPNVFDAPMDTAVSATYDQNMDPATVNFQSFAVHAMFTGWLTEAFSVQSGTITLQPDAPFHPGELVQVSATTATLSLGAEGPVSPTVWQFWAGAPGGSGVFTDSGQIVVSDDNRGMALGDLDGDGDLDAFIGDFEGGSQVFLNDGNGIFTNSGQALGIAGSTGIALGDLDGDGDLDVFESRVGPNQVWFNDGDANFTDSGQSLGAIDSINSSLGDLDGDGDLDVFVANGGAQGSPGAPNKVYLNDGDGNFTDSGQSLGLENSASIAIGDLDGDGDLDAFVTNGGFVAEANSVWFNDGSGLFIDSNQTLGNGFSGMGVLGDLDSDGDLDAYVSNLAPGGEADEVWINDGVGAFTLGQSVGNARNYSQSMGDVDSDGDLDVVVGGITTTVWLNDGSGNLTDSGQLLPVGLFVVLGDLNGDHALDIFMVNGVLATPPPDMVWFNVWNRIFLPVVYLP